MKTPFKTLLLAVLFLFGVGAASAQVTSTLVYGDTVSGTISQASPLVIYNFQSNASDLVNIQAFPLTTGTELSITLLSPAQQFVAAGDSNPLSHGGLEVRLTEMGVYSVLVGGINGSMGDFLLHLDARPATIQQPLIAGIPAIASFPGSAPVQYFSAAVSEMAQLMVRAQTPGFGFALEIRNAAGALVGISNSLPQATFSLPAGQVYEVGVRALNLQLPGTVEIVLGTGTTGAAPQSNVQSTPAPVVQAPADRCTITGAGPVNVRSGPGTNYNILGSLNPGQFLDVTGVSSDRMWYTVNYNNLQGWVSASVVSLNGPCGSIPVAQAPAPPQSAPTQDPNAGGNNTVVQPTATAPQEQPIAAPTATVPSQPVAPQDQDTQLSLDRNNGGQFNEQISAPDGDNMDRIFASVGNFDSTSTFVKYNVTLICAGTGTEAVRWGPNASEVPHLCNTSIELIFTNDSNSHAVVVSLPPGGSTPAFVNYTLLFVKIS
jgi:uncharacterized protein YraI